MLFIHSFRRQYFRLVTSEVSVWYEEHSTPNPIGIKPPDSVKIIKGNKFEQVRQLESHWKVTKSTEKEEYLFLLHSWHFQATLQEAEPGWRLSPYGRANYSVKYDNS